jgi:hypothetical protein
MSAFDLSAATPGLLKTESLSITLNFHRLTPTTGRVSWNIPSPAAGCGSGSQAYCGMVIVIDTNPITSSSRPTDNIEYASDSDISANTFAGDVVGQSKVIGAFFHDINTTIFDVAGLVESVDYYVAGFPVDCQGRFYKEGVHAYSKSLAPLNKIPDTNGTQRVVLNNTTGVDPIDPTGLLPNIPYDFNIELGIIPAPRTPINPLECNPASLQYHITVDGTLVSTYQDLIDRINDQLSTLDNPLRSSVPPNTGTLYWNNAVHKLSEWDGYHLNNVNCMVYPSDPTTPILNQTWLDSTLALWKWSGVAWISQVMYTTTGNIPNQPNPNSTIWIDSGNAYVWNGATWCMRDATTSTTDPSIQHNPSIGSAWVQGNTVYTMSSVGIWTSVPDVVFSHVDPLSIPNGWYWYNSSTNKIYIRNIPDPGWNLSSNYVVGSTAPTTPGMGKLWYDTVNLTLFMWDSNIWVPISDVVVSQADPTIVASCSMWVNGVHVYAWDIINTSWKLLPNYMTFVQLTDPTTAPVIAIGTVWIDSVHSLVYQWSGVCFKIVSDVVYSSVDPTALPTNTYWYNSTTQVVSVWDGIVWTVVTPIIWHTAPNTPVIGTKWFNTTNSSLQTWNGVNWVAISYVTSPPTPTVNTIWFDTTTGMRMSWDGSNWVLDTPRASLSLDCHGNLLFTDNTTGSMSFVQIRDGNLFSSLSVPSTIANPSPGTDGASGEPMWDALGIGTTGDQEYRLSLASQIKYELGYPIVDIELAPEQLDYAITKALSELRLRSGIGYKQGYFFLQTAPGVQRYLLTNKIQGMNKIVDVLDIQRVNALAGGTNSGGIYGQVFAQWLYGSGQVDLLSYHLVTEWKKTMEITFAHRIQYNFNEHTRELHLFQRFPYVATLAINASVERTEQDLLTDRYSLPWIRRYATAIARTMLAEIRGKYSSLPGAGGSISLNASELRSAADRELELCVAEIENFLVEDLNQYGYGGSFVMG